MSYRRTWLLTLPVLLILAMPSVTLCRSGDMQDVVYLKNGSIIRGIIVEQIPQESIRIQTVDGSVIVYGMNEIARITREKSHVTRPSASVHSKKHPVLAWFVSLLLPGGGQFYNGEVGKGALMLGAFTVGYVLALSSLDDDTWENDGPDVSAQAGAIIALGTWLWSMIDAPVSASKINRENGWTLAPFPDKDITLSVAGLSTDGKTAPGVVLSWKF